MSDDVEMNYDIPFPRYEWRVILEMKPVMITVEADTAEEAMEIADASYQLKTLPLDDLPELVMHYAAGLVQKICGGRFSKIVNFQLAKENKHMQSYADSRNVTPMDTFNINGSVKKNNTSDFKVI